MKISFFNNLAFDYFVVIIFSFLFFFLSERISKYFSYLDYPEKRRLHKQPTANLGGLGMMLIALVINFLTNIPSLDFVNIIIYSYMAGIIGLADDKFQFSPFKKIFLISIPIIILIYKNIYINNIGIYQGIGLIHLGPYSEIFTFLCCFVLINAFNYSDGIDGQASSLFISSNILSVILIKYFLKENHEINEVINFTKLFSLSLIIFLLYNYNFLRLPKLFMGNSGSLFLGFFLSFYLIYVFKLGMQPVLLIWCVNIVVFDFFTTTIIRLINKKNIMTPAFDHFHHQLKDCKLNSISINIISFTLNTAVGLIGILIFNYIGSITSLIAFLIFFLIFYFIKKNYLARDK